jgi:HTH-type transcriptional regulator / antitoxin MqsA
LKRGFRKQVNASVVDPAFIATVRNKPGLDRREAAEIFGGDATGFARYEKGETRPPPALVELLDRHPHLLSERREARIDA